MDCKHWNDNWVGWLYDECSAEERDAIDRHLAECEACRTHMDALEATRRAMHEAAPELAAPPRVIVLPAQPRRASGYWGFASGLAAAAVFVFGIFIGMHFFGNNQTVLEMAEGGGPDLSNPQETVGSPVTAERPRPWESGIQQVRNEYVELNDRLGRIERFMPEAQGDQSPRLLTEDRLQMAVGSLSQEFDVIRTRDLQLFMQAVYAAEQTARQRDITLSQAIELMNAEYNPHVRQR